MADHDAFVALVQRLRSLGAVRVRDGALEASFAAPESSPGERDHAPDPMLARAAAYLREHDEEMS